MSDTTPTRKGPCGVCKGSYDEHFDGEGKKKTQHAYTPLEGDLVTHEQMAKRETPQRVSFNPAMLMQSSGPQLGRLVEVMLDLNLIGVEQALYIAGMGAKPPAPSGYQDPFATVRRNQ